VPLLQIWQPGSKPSRVRLRHGGAGKLAEFTQFERVCAVELRQRSSLVTSNSTAASGRKENNIKTCTCTLALILDTFPYDLICPPPHHPYAERSAPYEDCLYRMLIDALYPMLCPNNILAAYVPGPTRSPVLPGPRCRMQLKAPMHRCTNVPVPPDRDAQLGFNVTAMRVV